MDELPGVVRDWLAAGHAFSVESDVYAGVRIAA
jgi:hypothetical protein